MKNNKRKYTLLLVCLLLAVIVAVGGTIAYIFTSSDPVVNTFTPVEIDNEIHENLVENVKSDVQIKNTGSIDAYIRAKVIVTWQNAAGEVYTKKPVSNLENPADYNYTIEYGTNWTKIPDGAEYWYYKSSVAPGEFTTELITSATPAESAPADGYTLHIEILSQAIQSEPVDAIKAAWGVEIAEYVEKVTNTNN